MLEPRPEMLASRTRRLLAIMTRIILSATWIGMGACLWLSAARPAAADESRPRVAQREEVQQNWYDYDEPSEYRPDPTAIIQQKAMIRAQQRQNRVAAMQWYGMSNSRPTAATTPFCSMYSPAWQMPGGRPFGWYASQRPIFIIR
jgi:hypothetical protein